MAGKKAIGIAMIVTVSFLIAELSYLYNLINIPLLKQNSETMWILGLITGFLITICCIAIFSYKSNKQSAKSEYADNTENETRNVQKTIVKIKR